MKELNEERFLKVQINTSKLIGNKCMGKKFDNDEDTVFIQYLDVCVNIYHMVHLNEENLNILIRIYFKREKWSENWISFLK